MKERRRIIHHCLSKVNYTEQGAEAARKVMVGRYRDARFNAYKCKFCPHWHVGKDNTLPRPRVFNFPEGWDQPRWI